MSKNYYLLTIFRNNKYETIIDYMSPIYFLIVEKELGHDTVIIFEKLLTIMEYNTLKPVWQQIK